MRSRTLAGAQGRSRSVLVGNSHLTAVCFCERLPAGRISSPNFRVWKDALKVADDPVSEQYPLAALTESQRRCLRLVLGHMTSKEIARELNLSSHTVDAHLKAAMRTLGVTSRVKAALILEAAERGMGDAVHHQPLVYQSAGMGSTGPMHEFGTNSDRFAPYNDVDYTELDETNGERKITSAHDAPASVDMESGSNENVHSRSSGISRYAASGGNRLSPWARLGIIMATCVVSIFLILSSMSALRLLSEMYN